MGLLISGSGVRAPRRAVWHFSLSLSLSSVVSESCLVEAFSRVFFSQDAVDYPQAVRSKLTIATVCSDVAQGKSGGLILADAKSSTEMSWREVLGAVTSGMTCFGEVAKWSNATRLGRVPSGSGVRTPPSSWFSRQFFFIIDWTW